MTSTCMRCGSSAQYLITYAYSDDATAGGRLLFYCGQCRDDSPHSIHVSIPLGLVTRDPNAVLECLYSIGAVGTDPALVAQALAMDASQPWVNQASAHLQRWFPGQPDR